MQVIQRGRFSSTCAKGRDAYEASDEKGELSYQSLVPPARLPLRNPSAFYHKRLRIG